MKITRFIPVLLIPLLFACLPKKPEIPMTEAPAGALMQAFEQRAKAFSSLKAIAGIDAVRKNRKRSFDSVGILVNKQEQYRFEVYSQLGQTLMTLVWNGKDMLVDLPDQRRVLPPKNAFTERILGADVDPAELSAILSGNIPGVSSSTEARMLCAEKARCLLELRWADKIVRAYPFSAKEEHEAVVSSYEMFHRDRLIYRVKFESFEKISGYALPKRIIIENPDKKTSLTIEYFEAEINALLDTRAFLIPGSEGFDK